MADSDKKTAEGTKKKPHVPLVFTDLPFPRRNDGEEEVGILFTNGARFRFGNRIGRDKYMFASILRYVGEGDRVSADEIRSMLGEGGPLEQADPGIRAWLSGKHRVQGRGNHKPQIFPVVDQAGKPVEKIVDVYAPGYGSAGKGTRHCVELPATALFRALRDDSGHVSPWRNRRRGRAGVVVNETCFLFQSVSKTDSMGAIEDKVLIAVIEPKLKEQGKKYVLERPGEVLIFQEAIGPRPDRGYGYVSAWWGVFNWYHQEFGLVDVIERMHGMSAVVAEADEIVVDDETTTDGAPASTESAATTAGETEASTASDGEGETDTKGGKKKETAKQRKAREKREAKAAKGGASVEA